MLHLLWYSHTDVRRTFSDYEDHHSLYIYGAERQRFPSLHDPERSSEVDKQLESAINYDLTTRNLSLASLILGWIVAIACLVIGAATKMSGRGLVPDFLLNKMMNFGNENYPFPTPPPEYPQAVYYLEGHRVFQMSQTGVFFVGLLLNIALTFIFDMMNYIHCISLKWALWHEGRLTYSSVPRLW
jgi:hypothetical protein